MIRRTLLSACALVAMLAGLTPASASPSPVYPEMHFKPVTTLKDSRGRVIGYHVCAEGDASFLYVFGAWDFRIDGTRTGVNGTVGPVVDEETGKSGSPYFDPCLDVMRLGYQTGHAHATFSYNGVGGDVPYTIEHTFTWCEGCPNPSLLLLDSPDLEDVQTEVAPL
jgi:hypothetical protein